MAMKNSALKVIVESTSSTDILKRRSIRIKMAQFIEDIENPSECFELFLSCLHDIFHFERQI